MTKHSFDYVIVGGGSAGCVLADRLSANGKYSVCLIEAGKADTDLRIKVPLGLMNLMKNPQFDWCFRSAPHAHLDGHTVTVPRGKTLGGSGSINSMVYIRGRASDYDAWAAAGAEGWAWHEVLPYFKQQENNRELGSNTLHGDGGPLHVQSLSSPHPLLSVLQQAGEELNIPASTDFNGATQEGLGVYQATMKNGRRWSAADAFLRPALRRRNLTVMTNAEVDRLVLGNRIVTGVRVRSKEGLKTIGVNKEVILCAGAIGSPTILLKSGIGSAAHLKQREIDVHIDAPGVGQNLHDHPAVGVFHGGGHAGYGLSLRNTLQNVLSPFNYLLFRRGLWASNTVEGGGFAKTEAALAEPDVQFHFIPARLGHQGKMIVWGQGYYSDVCLLKPKSRGQLTLAADRKTPNIDLNLLSDEEDFDRLIRGLELLRKLLAARAFDSVRSPELAPGGAVQTREHLRTYIKQGLGTAYHPVGTCRMGAVDDSNAVVGPNLKLIGSDNIRVIDASVMPEIVAGNTNAPTMMIAEKGAETVLQEAE